MSRFSMLNDARGFSRVFIATGYSDLRKGIDGLYMVNQKLSVFRKAELIVLENTEF